MELGYNCSKNFIIVCFKLVTFIKNCNCISKISSYNKFELYRNVKSQRWQCLSPCSLYNQCQCLLKHTHSPHGFSIDRCFTTVRLIQGVRMPGFPSLLMFQQPSATSKCTWMGGFSVWDSRAGAGVGTWWQSLPHSPHDSCKSKGLGLRPLE